MVLLGGVYSESYVREERFLTRWDQHTVAQRKGGGEFDESKALKGAARRRRRADPLRTKPAPWSSLKPGESPAVNGEASTDPICAHQASPDLDEGRQHRRKGLGATAHTTMVADAAARFTNEQGAMLARTLTVLQGPGADLVG